TQHRDQRGSTAPPDPPASGRTGSSGNKRGQRGGAEDADQARTAGGSREQPDSAAEGSGDEAHREHPKRPRGP
ncbi:FAD-dependent oxidoreductase, partial [Mycobacterium tuberculosis]